MKEISSLEFPARIKGLLKGEKGKRIIIFMGIIGMLLIVFSNFIPSEDNNTSDDTTSKKESGFEQYEQQLELRLEKIVGSISGVGSLQVMVTLESGSQYNYVTEKKSSTDKTSAQNQESENENTETQTVILSDSQGERALVKSETAPSVKGVIIVCEGGDDPTVQQRVISAVTTALDISSKKVCVTKMSRDKK